MPFNDITKILRSWQYEPSTLNVRTLEAEDGRELIQLRIELGVIQMELEGRPDGLLQDGHESLLALLEERGTRGGLDPDICRRLREEGVQRSHRAAALFALSRWDDVIRVVERVYVRSCALNFFTYWFHPEFLSIYQSNSCI